MNVHCSPVLGYEERFFTDLKAHGASIRHLSYSRAGGLCQASLILPGEPGEQLGSTDGDFAGRRVGAHASLPNSCKAVVLFCHATGNDRFFSLTSLYMSLIQSNYGIFAFDLDGHGRSSTHFLNTRALCLEKGADGMIPSALISLASECDKLGLELPLILMGQSLGAVLVRRYLSLNASTAYREPKGAVVLATPVAGQIMQRRLSGELLSVLSPSIWKALCEYSGWELLPAAGSFKRSLYPLRLAVTAEAPAVRFHSEAFRYGHLIDEFVAKTQLDLISSSINTPCLLVYGARDRMTPAAQADEFTAQLRHPASQLFEVPKETHFTLPFSRVVHRKLVAWLQALVEAAI